MPRRLNRVWMAVGLAGLALGAIAVPGSATAAPAQSGTSAEACASQPPVASPVRDSAVGQQAAGAAGVRIPQDEAPHQDPDEWWYFSGHLWGRDAAGHLHCYGFEYVTFQYLGIAPAPVYFGNLSITDLTRGTFQYGVEEDSYPVPNSVDRFSLHTGGWTMSGGSGRDQLHANLPGYTVDLHLQTNESPVLEGQGGTIPFGPLGTSQYYSWTSLLTGGTITDHGVAVNVAGISWMDHQWGDFDFASGAGWDWFSIQLSNGQQYMLYFIRDENGRIVQTIGTRVDRGGRTTHLEPTTFSEKITGSWQSPTTGITYSSGWQLTLPGGHLVVTPDRQDQELNLQSTQGVAYWEGDVSLHGQIDGQPVTGVGYTEINPPDQP
jgi:predicted secreted hydrolase